MQKQVVRFGRETTLKDDICYKEKSFNLVTKGVSCSNCRVHIVTDRFLSRNFQKEVIKDSKQFPKGTYPYVIILDAAQCNIKCRACYAQIYWKPETRAMPTFVDEETLAKQFICKLEKLHDETLITNKRIGEKTKRPFSRFRISGGEPLWIMPGSLSSFSGESSIDFWIYFFKNLDKEITELILNKKITLKSEKEWVTIPSEDRKRLFPIFLRSDNNKIRVRFDTNGWLFKDESFAKKFIEGVYDLKLKNIKIDLTLSLKGTNTYEVDLFTKPNVNFDESKLYTDEPLENHPQWKAIENIVKIISERESKDVLNKKSVNLISETYFNPQGEVSLTIEKGIMHNPYEKLYLYNKKALDWDKFSEKLKKKGLLLSKTENCIYLGQFPNATAWRYINQGYEIRFKCELHNKKPFLSYSKEEKSLTGSLKHRQIKSNKDSNLSHFVRRIKIQNENKGKKCRYSDCLCNFWIELIPI